MGSRAQLDENWQLITGNCFMDWNSRRITAILENALHEDRATSDATSYACIDPNQRASATIIAKQECILAGLGCVPRILDVYAALDGAVTSHYEVTSHPSIFDGIRVKAGQQIAVIQHNARVMLSCERVILNFLQRMAGIATTLPYPLHAHLLLLAQSGRALVWTHNPTGDPPRIFQKRQGTDRQNQPIRPALQQQIQTLRLDRNRRFHLPETFQTM